LPSDQADGPAAVALRLPEAVAPGGTLEVSVTIPNMGGCRRLAVPGGLRAALRRHDPAQRHQARAARQARYPVGVATTTRVPIRVSARRLIRSQWPYMLQQQE
jgi:hypothetical protein